MDMDEFAQEMALRGLNLSPENKIKVMELKDSIDQVTHKAHTSNLTVSLALLFCLKDMIDSLAAAKAQNN